MEVVKRGVEDGVRGERGVFGGRLARGLCCAGGRAASLSLGSASAMLSCLPACGGRWPSACVCDENETGRCVLSQLIAAWEDAGRTCSRRRRV
jgi:hypothetical protein